MHGSLILVVAMMLVKVIGAIYKIPLANILGGDGGGYYSTAYDLYLPIYTLAMGGLPVALSRMVAESVGEARFKDTKALLKIARMSFLVTGLIGTVIMLLLTVPYTNFVAKPGAIYSVLLIAPAILFCCAMSTYRGYYEGLRNMYPTAVSQVIEALGKLVIGLLLAWGVKQCCLNEFERLGTVFGKAVEADVAGTPMRELAEIAAMPYAAAGAVLGVTLGTALGALYTVIHYRITGDKISREEYLNSPPARPMKENFKALICIAVPIVIGSLVTNISSLVDVTIVQKQLDVVVTGSADAIREMYGSSIKAGLADGDISNYLYGCYKMYAYSIYNLVPALTSVFGVSAIPVLATVWSQKNKLEVRSNIEQTVRISSMIALPAGLGIMALSGPILTLLYSGNPEEVAIATPILRILGITAVFAGLTVPITSMLQAIGRVSVPVKNMAVGVVLKIVVNYILVGIPSINVIGAPVGTAVCYGYIFFANIYCLRKYSGVHISFKSTMMKPMISAVICAVSAVLAYSLTAKIISSVKACALTSMAIACLIYLISLILLRGIAKNDLLTLPKGEKIAKTLEKLKWIR